MASSNLAPATQNVAGLEIRNIQKRFDSQSALSAALSSLNLNIRKGEFFSLLGPSGCGKSTLLRILAGLEQPDSGQILWDGQDIGLLPARERPFKMVFQKYALFPHLTVFENVAFGLRLKRTPETELKQRVEEALTLVNMKDMSRRFPDTLSGGQAQRVALARAVVNRPACVLLDEPLTALDQKLREHMQTELRSLQKRLGLTFIFVTHDQEEAMMMSDRIAVMNGGQVEQVASPQELFEEPQSLFCARFIGRRNEIPIEHVSYSHRGSAFQLAQGSLSDGKIIRGRSTAFAAASLGQTNVGHGRAFVRPDRVRVIASEASSTENFNVLDGRVTEVLYRGTFSEIAVAVDSSLLIRAFSDRPPSSFALGTKVRLEFAPADTHIFDEPVNRSGEIP